MTHEVTPLVRGSIGNIKYLIATVDITSYTTDGEVLTLSELGFDTLDFMAGTPEARADIYLQFDVANLKVLASVASTGLQAASETDVKECRILFLGDAAW